jgi:hypothetical protein
MVAIGTDEGGEAMKLYEVQNRITKERQVVEAESAQEACEKCGWMIGDCFVGERGRFFPTRDLTQP